MGISKTTMRAIKLNLPLAKQLKKEFIARTVKYTGPNPKFENCRIWQGATFSGRGNYGAATFRKLGVVNFRAHRLSYMLFRKCITSDDHVLHKCDNPLCVYPKHLFIGDQVSNMKDKVDKNRQNKGEIHGMHKLTEKEAIKVISDTRKHGDIAKDFNISISTVYDIKRGRSWKHLPRPHFGRYKTYANGGNVQAARL